METPKLRVHYEEVAEKEEPRLISTERRVKRRCESNAHKPPGTLGHKAKILHRKEIFSDGWTRWVCSKCGQVKFTTGITFKEGK